MANLGPIDFKIGLYIKVNVIEGQNKCEDHILKHLARNWQNIGQMPLFRVNIKLANSVTSHFSSNFYVFFKCSVF